MNTETGLSPDEQLILLCHRLKQKRIKLNCSQDQLAKAIGMHVNAVSRYERNCGEPSLLTVLKVCRALSITLAELLDETLPS